jgi:hypothetical protein
VADGERMSIVSVGIRTRGPVQFVGESIERLLVIDASDFVIVDTNNDWIVIGRRGNREYCGGVERIFCRRS